MVNRREVHNLVTDELRAMLGSTVSYVAPEPLSGASIRYFATAIGADIELWRDEAPPTFICETAQLTGHAVPDSNGYLGHVWNLPLPLRCAMFRGGNDYRFGRPARADDVITTTWMLNEALERRDSAGDPLLLVTAEATYRAAGDVLSTNTETMIFRPLGRSEPESAQRDQTDAARAGPDQTGPDQAGPGRIETGSSQPSHARSPGASQEAPPEARSLGDGERPGVGKRLPPLVRSIELADMVAYGAATWDWHRLHYDDAHARRLGAPAPMVDGQMLGALLGECVLRYVGANARLTRLHYRNRAPVVRGETVVCSGTIATVDDAGFSIDLAVSVDGRPVVAPAFAQLAWTDPP